MAHQHTILGQMLQMFSRFEFQKAVKQTKTEYRAHGFSSWTHFVSMLFSQLSGQDSLGWNRSRACLPSYISLSRRGKACSSFQSRVCEQTPLL